MRRRVVLGALATVGGAAPAWLLAQNRPEVQRVSLWAHGWTQLSQLPLVLATHLGFFRAEGLHVDLHETPGWGVWPAVATHDSLALMSSPYEQVLQWRAQGRATTAFAQVSKTPQVVLGVATRGRVPVQQIRDLQGLSLGVMGWNSPSHQVMLWSLLQAGLAPEDVSWVDVGAATGALWQFKTGRVQAVAATDPAATWLEQGGAFRVLLDTRVPGQSERLFGGAVPGTCLVAMSDALRQYPHTCQAVVHGLAHALQWLRTAGPTDLIKALPEAYLHGDRAVYLAAFNKTRQSLLTDGHIPTEAPRQAHKVWARLNGLSPTPPPDLAASYTNAWVGPAKSRFKI